ncbi:glutathione S-transferase [Roseomonas alkaliterrae]|uniref:Glutathione S-transferase n=1 Tax=Neoroseomonas alkaliterrae TaxID=1452450 RepID=A0A840XWE1_9PROT|nr:glutathione S-transferase family protein [Neoroseomonas alkaliterrae]MBB5691470.1 glutathione S-transferase [Neoroseomonas alkaliterrae]MBR0675686.1 glutathione S-transferase [Neoroseomonas alkaliterrae]
MRLFHAPGSPYARIARMAVIELGLEDRIAVEEATLRDPGSVLLPFNPVGRVPTLVLADGTAVTETTPVLMVLDSLVEPPRRLLPGAEAPRALAAYGRVLGMMDGIAVWNRELRRPEHERSPGVIALERVRAARIADALERDVAGGGYVVRDAGWLALVALLGYCERRHRAFAWREGRPALAALFDTAQARPCVARTVPPEGMGGTAASG